jgi:flagella basal body P-ring formation protein FlgA
MNALISSRAVPGAVRLMPACVAATLQCLLVAPGHSAAVFQEHAAIRRAAEAAVVAKRTSPGARLEIAAESLDERLRLPACTAPLRAVVPDGDQQARRISVEVRCEAGASWKLYVPVRVIAKGAVAVTARPIPRGKVLTPNDVILAERDTGALSYGYVTSLDAVVGRTVRRPINAGVVVTPGVLETELLVRRGQEVTLEARSNVFAVRSGGVAQGDGALGQIIKIRNSASGKTVQGIVRSEKLVEVLLQ